jgi:hypothetical protein
MSETPGFLVFNLANISMTQPIIAMDVYAMTDERSFLYKLSTPFKCIIVVSALLSLLIGSCMKFCIYKHLLRFKLLSRPINILILIEQLIHHLISLALIPWVIIWLTTDTTAALFFEVYFR